MAVVVVPPPSSLPTTTVDTSSFVITTDTRILTLSEIDEEYEHVGCLGHGGFGSVFLARKRSSTTGKSNKRQRYVAIKAMRLHENVDFDESYQRELDALVTLNTRDDGTHETEHRDSAIAFLRDWFETPDNDGSTNNHKIAFLVLNYYEGGTLADHITDTSMPFSERRIAWYLLQLCEALAYAHDCNVSHHDVKSDNVLMDSRGGGKLVLTDFGTSVRPGQEKIGYTVRYSPPELLAAHRSTNQSMDMIDPLGVDAFGIGCIALELLLCSQLMDVTALDSTTVADLASSRTLVTTFDQLGDASPYSSVLRQQLVFRLLDPNPINRLPPQSLAKDLREHYDSPLLTPTVTAAYAMEPRGHVTMDNIQLGCFVQRGPDWDDDDDVDDGGEGCIGVVVELDPDALYCVVAWPSKDIGTHRIGANCRMELSISQPLPNNILNGFLESSDSSKYSVGMVFERADHPMNGMVIVKVVDRGIFLTPPVTFQLPNDFKNIPKLPCPPETPVLRNPASPRDPKPYPAKWGLNPNLLVEVTDASEKDLVSSLFHADTGGLSKSNFIITSIQRVQSVRLWDSYARRCAVVENENWTSANEQRLFHGTSKTPTSTILNDHIGFDPRFCDGGRYGRGSYFAVHSSYSHNFAHSYTGINNEKWYEMFLARVALGRMQVIDNGSSTSSSLRRPKDGCHSVKGKSTLSTNNVSSTVHVIYETTTQAYPEYLITYRKAPQRGIIQKAPQIGIIQNAPQRGIIHKVSMFLAGI